MNKLGIPKPYRIKLKQVMSSIPLTEKQYRVLREWKLEANNRPFDFRTENFDELIKKSDVERLYKVKINHGGGGQLYFCEYGERHHADNADKCHCQDKYKNMSGLRFQNILRKKGCKVVYNGDITEEMKEWMRHSIELIGYDNTKAMDREAREQMISTLRCKVVPTM